MADPRGRPRIALSIDQIEAFGKAVDEGLITLDQATSDLADASSGELDKARAAHLIANWREVCEGADAVLDLIAGMWPDDPEGP